MDDDNYDLTSLPSSVSLEDSYTPKSAGDSPFDGSPSEERYFKFPPKQSQPQSPQSPDSPFDDFEIDDSPTPSPKEKYEWINIDDPKWMNFLLSNNFYVKDCVPDGNCQFRSLEEALKVDKSLKKTHKQLRLAVAKYILKLNDVEFKNILASYRSEKDEGEFYGQWDPYSINTKKEFAALIKEPGFKFEGDNLTLSLLAEILKVDILIFNEATHTIIPIEKNNDKFLIIYFIKMGNTGHYKTVGFKVNNEYITLFNKSNLPEDVLALIDKNVFYKKQLKRIYKSADTFTCNNVLLELKNLLIRVPEDDKNLVCKLAAQMINKEDITPKKKAPKRKSKAKSKAKSKTSRSSSKTTSRKSKSRKSKKSKSKRKSVKKSKSKRKSVKKSKSKRKSVKKSKSKSKSKRKSVKKSKSKRKSVKKSKSKRKSVKKSKSKRKSVKKSKSKRKSVKKARKRQSKPKKL